MTNISIITMSMVTRFIKVLIHYEKLSLIIAITPQLGGPVRSLGKLNTLNLNLQKDHGHQTSQSAYLP